MTDYTLYRDMLTIELTQVTNDLKELGIHNPGVKEDWIATPAEVMNAEPDKNILADKVEDWQERRGTLATLETRYNNITRALVKIKNGTYGTCEICGDSIEEDRLTANPAARTNKAHINNEAQLPA